MTPVQLTSLVRTFGLARRGGTPSGDPVAVVVETEVGPDQSGPHLHPASFESDLGPAGPGPQGHPGSPTGGSLTRATAPRLAVDWTHFTSGVDSEIPSSWLVIGPLFLCRRLTQISNGMVAMIRFIKP